MPTQDYLLRHGPFDEPQYIPNLNSYSIDSHPTQNQVSADRQYSSEPGLELPGQNDKFDADKGETHDLGQDFRVNLVVGLAAVLNSHQLNMDLSQQQMNVNQLGHNHAQSNILPNHLIQSLNFQNEAFAGTPHSQSAAKGLAPSYRQYLNPQLGLHRGPGELTLMPNIPMNVLAVLLRPAGLTLTLIPTSQRSLRPSLVPSSGAHLAANVPSHIESAIPPNLPATFIQILPEESLMDNLVPIAPDFSQMSSSLPQLSSRHDIDPLFGASLATPEYNADIATKKVAPRSKDLYRIGPPFGATNIHRPVYCVSSNEQVFPQIDCRLDRGFELGEAGNWIGYKRNYFTMVLAFTFHNWSMDAFVENRYQVMDKNNPENRLQVSHFVLSVLAKCSDPEVQIGLVQHTPKRDKGPQYKPPVYPAVPGSLPDHQTVMASSNKRNTKKIRTLSRIFSFDRAAYYTENNMDPQKDQSILRGYPSDVISRVARFERIQFSASIRVKQKSNNVHKFFTLIVELSAVVSDEDRTLVVPVASCSSAPLLVRGRSPSNYPREKTSGYRQKEV